MEVITSMWGKYVAPKHDAFPGIKRQVEELLSHTDQFVQQYKSRTASSEERTLLKKQIETNLSVIEDSIAPIVTSIGNDNDPTNPKRTFVATVRSKMNVIKGAVQPPPEFKKARLSPTFAKAPAKTSTHVSDTTNNDGELMTMLDTQKKLMSDQDEMLDALMPSIMQLKEVSLAIRGELGVHSQLLDEMETKVDRTNLVLNNTNRRVTTLRRQI